MNIYILSIEMITFGNFKHEEIAGYNLMVENVFIEEKK